MVGCAWKRSSVILHDGFSSTYGLHLFTLSAALLYTLSVSRFKLRPVLRTAYHFLVSMNIIIVWIFFSSSTQAFSAPAIPKLYHKSSVIDKSSKSSVVSKSYVISNSSVVDDFEDGLWLWISACTCILSLCLCTAMPCNSNHHPISPDCIPSTCLDPLCTSTVPHPNYHLGNQSCFFSL